VLIIGGGGYIGKASAFALRRRGHHVTAVIRSSKHSQQLIAGEVNVIEAPDAIHFEKYEKEFLAADVIIYSVMDLTDFLGKDAAVFAKYYDALQKHTAAGHPKKVLIYTSGGLVLKSNKEEKLNEDSPLTDHPFLQGRIQLEKSVLATKDAHGVVVRPSMVYGGERGHFTTYFQQAEEGKVVVSGDGSNIFSSVHIEDIAYAYVTVVEASHEKVSGQVFNFSDGIKVTTLTIAQTFAAAVGYKGSFETGKEFPFALFADAYLWYGYEKAEKVLGWKPTRKSILDEALILYKSWKASGAPAVF